VKVAIVNRKQISKESTKIREDDFTVYIESSDIDMIITINKKNGYIDIEERAESCFEDATILEHGKLTLEW
jgi:hypothetical protein